MKNLSNWVQLATTVSVLIGLALVVYELQQTRELAVMQISSEGWVSSQQLDSLLVGEELAGTMARISDPEAELSKADLYRYDGYAFARLTAIRRNAWLSRSGFYDAEWETFVDTTTACYYFGSDVGLAYLNSPAVQKDDVVMKLIELVENCETSDSYVQNMLKSLKEGRVER